MPKKGIRDKTTLPKSVSFILPKLDRRGRM